MSPDPAYVISDADISDDERYRYALWRYWDDGPAMGWIGLNPSTADAKTDDQTIRRMCGYARREGFSGIAVLNLFALRATDPARLRRHQDPVGPENDRWLKGLAGGAADGGVVVAAWGAHPFAAARAAKVRALFGSAPLWCLGTNSDGSPRHPSRLDGTTPLIRYQEA